MFIIDHFFSLASNDFVNDILISRLFSLLYKKRPKIVVKLIFYWQVEIFSALSEILAPVYHLSQEQLTIKTFASIAITTSDREQTLHLMNIEKILISDTSILFI